MCWAPLLEFREAPTCLAATTCSGVTAAARRGAAAARTAVPRQKPVAFAGRTEVGMAVCIAGARGPF